MKYTGPERVVIRDAVETVDRGATTNETTIVPKVFAFNYARRIIRVPALDATATVVYVRDRMSVNFEEIPEHRKSARKHLAYVRNLG